MENRNSKKCRGCIWFDQCQERGEVDIGENPACEYYDAGDDSQDITEYEREVSARENWYKEVLKEQRS